MEKKRTGIGFLYVLLAIVVIFLIFKAFENPNPPDEINFTQFSNMIGLSYDEEKQMFFFEHEKNNVDSIAREGNTFYILVKPRDGETRTNADITNFWSDPAANAAYYVYVQEPYQVVELLLMQNAENKLPADPEDEYYNDPEHVYDASRTTDNQINFRQRSVPQSFLDALVPFLYIGAILFLAFIILRSMSGRNGLGNMGRNRATITQGGEVRFADVAGIEEEKEEVQEIVEFLRTPKKFLDLGARIPKGFLLVGAPGTGKTLLAKAIAGEAGVPFLSISGSDFSEMLVGVGPSRMRDLFEQAKSFPNGSIIFIDEIDSIARMRGVGVSGVSDENEQTLNQLLVQMDGFTKSEGVIVLAATNRPDVLDQALLRPGRFDRQIIVQMPDVRGREKILEVHCRKKPIGSDVNLGRVAKIISGFSGADIENLMNESAIIAAKKEKVMINMADITEGINKVLLGPQKRSRIITEQDKKITAFHEAGHAIVSRLLQEEHVVQEVSIIPRGMAAGYTLTNDKDSERHHKSRSFLKTQIAVYMSGRVAEEIFVGDICTGCSQDLKQATGMAEKMVTMFGMSDKLGPLYYGREEEIALRMANDKKMSEALQSTIDGEVKVIIMDAEKVSRTLLKANSAKVHVMANVLLERETIYAEDIALIMEGKSEKQVIAEMEKRDMQSKKQAADDKIESDVKTIEREQQIVMEMAKAFREAKILDDAAVEKVKQNFELAKTLTRGGSKPKIMPTLDNIVTYEGLVSKKDAAKDTDKTDKKISKAAEETVKKTEE